MINFEAIKWEPNPTNLGGTNSEIFLSKDRKFLKKIPSPNHNYLKRIPQELINLLKHKQVIPIWQYVFIPKDKSYAISEYRDDAFKKELTPQDKKLITNKIEILESISFDSGNGEWLYNSYLEGKFKCINIEKTNYELQFAFNRLDKFFKHNALNKRVLSHNDLTIRNICFENNQAYFIDLEYLAPSFVGWDLAQFKNQCNDIIIDNQSENNLRFVHAFVWWLKFFTFDVSKRTTNVNYTKYFNQFEKIWKKLLFKKINLKTNYWENETGKIKYFKEVSMHNFGKGDSYNELMLFHNYWTRDLFLKFIFKLEKIAISEIEAKTTLNIWNTKQIKKIRGLSDNEKKFLSNDTFRSLRNSAVHGDVEKLKKWSTPESYIDNSFKTIEDVFFANERMAVSFLKLYTETMKYNEYIVDGEAWQKLTSKIEEQLIKPFVNKNNSKIF